MYFIFSYIYISYFHSVIFKQKKILSSNILIAIVCTEVLFQDQNLCAVVSSTHKVTFPKRTVNVA